MVCASNTCTSVSYRVRVESNNAVVPVTTSLKVPATMKVKAEVCAMTVNSTHTIMKASRAPTHRMRAVTPPWARDAK